MVSPFGPSAIEKPFTAMLPATAGRASEPLISNAGAIPPVLLGSVAAAFPPTWTSSFHAGRPRDRERRQRPLETGAAGADEALDRRPPVDPHGLQLRGAARAQARPAARWRAGPGRRSHPCLWPATAGRSGSLTARSSAGARTSAAVTAPEAVQASAFQSPVPEASVELVPFEIERRRPALERAGRDRCPRRS